ncbi:MGH1-like glycoside hydrolase domain-containing protein [Mariniflexile sp. HMF6888]|uniref:MGH1-like glycoside hydrolase domain-containing protein n=1 Tax=Mariniflexile sp. HMF6888 TaxID=3373086 RepID=UPI00378CCE44
MTNKLIYSLWRISLIGVLTFFYSFKSYSQPYYPTYVKNELVKQNIFKTIAPDTTLPPSFQSSREKLPEPIWSKRPDVIKCYWKTWEIAFSNLKQVNNENGFISPYIDPAFNGDIFMWDCSYMTMFGKYAKAAFNFQNTLNNFYAKQHPDGFICREIRESDGTDVFERFDPSSTGPDIMPWAEWEYFKNFNDIERLKNVFPVLLAYFDWYSTYRTWPDGTYYSSGWGCGMDNQQRVPENYNAEFSHGFMSWIDISFQEVFAANILIEMAKVLGRELDVDFVKNQRDKLSDQINNFMWDDSKKYYFDRFRNGELSNTKSIASYWGLLAGSVPKNRIDVLVKHLQDTSMFERKHRVPTLAADDPNFNSNGGYWNGAVWAPTNYMVLRGLTKYEFDSLAYQIAFNHVNNVVEVFNKTNTLWENYSPDKVQGNDHSNFVGWTGLAPINVLFEYVFGIRPNIQNNELLIDVNLTDEYGIKHYPYGINGSVDILCRKRKSVKEKPLIMIITNVPLKLIVKWSGGKLEKEINEGKTNL